MLNHVDRFHAAVSVLAGHGNVKQRLMKAYEEHLDGISDEDMPVALKQEFADLRTVMYRVAPLNGEGPVCASVRKMSVEEASEYAVSVVSLYHEIMRSSDDADEALPLEDQELRPVPTFLVKSS